VIFGGRKTRLPIDASMSAIQFLVLAALVLSSGANEETLVVKIGWLITKVF